MNLPLDYLNTLYKLAIEREKAEQKRREEQQKNEEQIKKLETLASKAEANGNYDKANQIREKIEHMRNNYSGSALTTQDLELIEDELGVQ